MYWRQITILTFICFPDVIMIYKYCMKIFMEFIIKQMYTSNIEDFGILNIHVKWNHVISTRNKSVRLTIFEVHIYEKNF